MLDGLIRFSVHNKLIILALVAGLIGAGLYALGRLPINAVPDITNNQVQVVTVSPALAPQEVEQFVTFPVELALANLPGVVDLRSISRYGLSVVTVVFEEDVPVLEARQLVSEQLRGLEGEIPPELGVPGLMPITTGLGEIYQYTLEVKPGYESRYDAMKLREIQDWIVKRQLSGVRGLAEVSSFGGYLKQYEVAADPARLRGFGLTISDIRDALAAHNENAGGSYVQKGPLAFYLRAEGRLRSLEEIGQIPVARAGGGPVLLRDVAEVRFGHAPRFGAMTANGAGEAVGGITLMLKGENASAVVARVRERMERVRASLPEGLEINVYLDRAEFIGRVINTVKTNLIEGGLIVIFVLVLLLGNLRAGFVVASVIPLALLFALTCMHAFGVSANLMSLGAIDFGLVVDGTVIVVERVVHDLRRKFSGQTLDRSTMDKTVTDSAISIRGAAAFGEVVILVVYIPIVALAGVEGRMFRPMALTVGFAILGALILSMTYVPAVSALVLSRKPSDKPNFADRFVGRLKKAYLPALQVALRFRWATLGIAAAGLAAAGWVFAGQGAVFLPTLEEGDLAMQMTLPPGSSLARSIETAGKAERILLEHFPEVKQVVSKIGTAEVPTDPMPVEDADIMIILKPREEWTSANTREELIAAMEAKLARLETPTFEFTQPIQLRFNELMTGAKSDLAIKIFGEDLDVLFQQSNRAAELIRGIPGAADVKAAKIDGLPQLRVRYDRAALARYGVSVAGANAVVQAAFAGAEAGAVYEGERKFDLVVRLPPGRRRDFGVFGELYVRGAEGGLVPLTAVAEITRDVGPMEVAREEGRRYALVGVNVRGRDVQTLVEEIRAKLDAELALPPGYYVKYGGAFENLQSALARLRVVVPAALALIFLLLFFTFGSVRQTLIIFTAIPFAAIGGVFALASRGLPFSISAAVGFIALSGVAVLNGIVMIAYFNQLKKEGLSLRERTLEGAGERLRPVLMTAAVASLGFLPMALSETAGAEVQRPLATVVIGGLVTATLLTLFVLPVLYELSEKLSLRLKGKSAAALLLLFIVPASAFAQTAPERADTLTFDEAAARLRARHPLLQAGDLGVRAAEARARAALAPGPLSVELQRGQLNAENVDAFWTARQEFGAPLEKLALRKAALQEAEYRRAARANTETAALNQMAQAWHECRLADARRRLLESFDAEYARMAEIARTRFDQGEAGELPLAAAEQKRARLRMQAESAAEARRLAELRLRRALFADGPVAPDTSGPLRAELAVPPGQPDSAAAQSPAARMYGEDLARARADLKAERAARTPAVSAGYFRQQLEGAPGFDGWLVEVRAPLPLLGAGAEAEARRLEAERAEAQYNYQVYSLEQELAFLLGARRRLEARLDYYEQTAAPAAKRQQELARAAWEAGETDYSAYFQTLENALDLRLEYLETLRAYNRIIINLNYLAG